MGEGPLDRLKGLQSALLVKPGGVMKVSAELGLRIQFRVGERREFFMAGVAAIQGLTAPLQDRRLKGHAPRGLD